MPLIQALDYQNDLNGKDNPNVGGDSILLSCTSIWSICLYVSQHYNYYYLV